MSTMGRIDITKRVQKARETAVQARMQMFAAFAQLQLDVQSTHARNWDSLSVRQLEDKIDDFKLACEGYRAAEDHIIVAMSMGADRIDSAVPSPEDLWRTKAQNPGWKTVMQDGIEVLVPESTPDATPPSE